MEKPFSKSFVLRTTCKHMRRSVDISIRKSFDRMGEFEGTPKGGEVFETLDVLHKMRKMIDDFQEANAHLFNDKDNHGE